MATYGAVAVAAMEEDSPTPQRIAIACNCYGLVVAFWERFEDGFYWSMGFSCNPMRISRNRTAADLRLSMLSNYCTSYNVLSISLALNIMAQVYATEITDAYESLCSSALIAGMIVGQLVGGALGDMIGRHNAMAFVLWLQVISAFLSAFCFDIGSSISIFEVLAFWRFLLGVGCGGVYPLAATLTTESSPNNQDRTKLVALTFSFQGVGYITVPTVAWIVVAILGSDSDIAWRILLGVGCIPGIWVTALRMNASNEGSTQQRRELAVEKDTEHTASEPDEAHHLLHLDSTTKNEVATLTAQEAPAARILPTEVMASILQEPDLVRKLLGTAGAWLLFDVTFYGNNLFEPVVLSAAFGDEETVLSTASDTWLVDLIALPGYFVSIYVIGGSISPRFIQMQGFLLMGVIFYCIGIFFDPLQSSRWALLVLYGSTFFFANFGPNTTTFMLPSMTFSQECRATLNGVSAAAGKFGALIGSSVFVQAEGAFGLVTVFYCCASLSILGLVLTWLCVDSNVGKDLPEQKLVDEVALDEEENM